MFETVCTQNEDKEFVAYAQKWIPFFIIWHELISYNWLETLQKK